VARTVASTWLLLALTGLVGAAAPAAAGAEEKSITLPAEQVHLEDGPNADVARRDCSTCHSAEYVYMQPPLTAGQWRAEVAKMKNAYGAPIDEKDFDLLVTYLVSQNGAHEAPPGR
jgi:mono/diheme cytochrome c family protein